MKLYRKQIRPNIYSPTTQMFDGTYYKPLIKQWHYEEDVRPATIEMWKQAVERIDAQGSLKLEERYVEYVHCTFTHQEPSFDEEYDLRSD